MGADQSVFGAAVFRMNNARSEFKKETGGEVFTRRIRDFLMKHHDVYRWGALGFGQARQGVAPSHWVPFGLEKKILYAYNTQKIHKWRYGKFKMFHDDMDRDEKLEGIRYIMVCRSTRRFAGQTLAGQTLGSK